eukprot:10612294-Ditylum_brightwellii.AAC.1
MGGPSHRFRLCTPPQPTTCPSRIQVKHFCNVGTVHHPVPTLCSGASTPHQQKPPYSAMACHPLSQNVWQ